MAIVYIATEVEGLARVIDQTSFFSQVRVDTGRLYITVESITYSWPAHVMDVSGGDIKPAVCTRYESALCYESIKLLTHGVDKPRGTLLLVLTGDCDLQFQSARLQIPGGSEVETCRDTMASRVAYVPGGTCPSQKV